MCIGEKQKTLLKQVYFTNYTKILVALGDVKHKKIRIYKNNIGDKWK